MRLSDRRDSNETDADDPVGVQVTNITNYDCRIHLWMRPAGSNLVICQEENEKDFFGKG